MSALGNIGAPTKAQRKESDELSRQYLRLSEQGMSGRQIAEIYGVSQGNVSRRIARAKAGCNWKFKPRGRTRG